MNKNSNIVFTAVNVARLWAWQRLTKVAADIWDGLKSAWYSISRLGL